MTFLLKIAFYVMFGMSCFFVLFLFFNAVYTLMDAYGKKSEAIIMVLGGALMVAGTYFTYLDFNAHERYLYACGILGLTWLITLITILIGLLFFNGPIRWN